MFATPVTVPDDSLFSSPSATSDITLVVDGRNLHVSKCVLGLASPVFLKMFEGDFKDKTEIPLADKKYEDVVELLLCIYPSTSAVITRASLDVVLPLANEYGIESIKRRCEEFVLSQVNDPHNPSNEELVHFLYLADKYKLSKLLDACVDKAKNRTYECENGIKRIKEFSLMSSDAKFRVISERMSKLEEPVRSLLKYAKDKYVKENLSSILNPTCEVCKSGSLGIHFGHGQCRKTQVAHLETLCEQLHALYGLFLKDIM